MSERPRQWTLDFGDGLEHEAGQTISFSQAPQLYFKPETMFVSGDVEISTILFGSELVHHLPSQYNRIKESEVQVQSGKCYELDLPTAQPYETIQVVVTFKQKCKFEATMLGQGKKPERIEIKRDDA